MLVWRLKSSKTWEFPKIMITFFGVPMLRILVFWGLYWGPSTWAPLPWALDLLLVWVAKVGVFGSGLLQDVPVSDVGSARFCADFLFARRLHVQAYIHEGFYASQNPA